MSPDHKIPHAQPIAAPSKILVIDGNIYEQVFLQKLIDELKHDFRLAPEGQQGMSMALDWKPDVILLNVQLPDGSGIELLKQIRSKPGLEKIPVILMSPDTSEKAMVEGLSSGANDVIITPIRTGELAIRLDHMLRMKSYEEDLQVLNKKLQREKKLLSKYFSEDMVEEILKEDQTTNLSGTNLTASILFYDLRNSTGLGEKLTPKLFAEFLSEMFTDIMDLVYGNGGSVNKLLGDGMMATFGAPVSSGVDAFNAVNTALQIREYLATFNDVRPDYLTEPIHAGIGVATGKVFAGNIGSVRRIEYTLLGDPVNTASRLESLTKEAKVDILIDGNTREALGNKIKVNQVKFNIRGKINTIDIFHLENWL